MTDRELLELAAKAAGLKEGIGGAFWTEDGGVFDPLTNDGMTAVSIGEGWHLGNNLREAIDAAMAQGEK